jgi:preprotein translocase subunit SecD
MARKTARPGRTLGVFFLGLAIAFGLVALAGSWKPELGLDLQGGTSIRLTPKGNPSSESLEEARKIVDQRVNGSGVAEAEVTVQGNRFIVVEIPGESRRDLVETVKRQAQLRFRVVACSDVNPGPCATAAPTDPTQQDPTQPTVPPGTGVEAPSATPTPTAAPTDGATDAPTDTPTDATTPSGSANRAPVHYADGTGSPTPTPTETPSDGASETPSEGASADATTAPSDGATPSEDPVIPSPEGGADVGDPLKWMDAPNPEAVAAFNAFTCPQDGTPVNVEDDPKKPLVTCEWDSENKIATKYLLSASMIEGSELDSAAAVVPQQQVNYVVSLDFNGDGTKKFAEISKALVNTEKQFAVVLDGQVISAPTMNGLITNGQAQIEGNFTQASAKSLATSLKFGALPVSFADFSVQTVGPSLAGDQLTAGITAGIIGLLLVMIYCLIYYRGLGIVVVSSLLVAGASTYAMVLLLSKTANFTLTLPGIAGLIVAVGITADSFIVYFERIRDEMREGRSMRVAVEAGWIRARATCLAADAVSLLAAIVLYIFAAGVVRGFAFALGLSTIIDLVVFFWFTKPLVSVLARYHFFNGGGKLSGLSAETLGVDAIAPDRPKVAAATRSTALPSTEGGKA